MEVEVDQSASSPPGAPLRGMCYDCAVEVVPIQLATEEFQCPLCRETAIECPYESFDRWSGFWHVSYSNGTESHFVVDDRGSCLLMRPSAGGVGAVAVPLLWAPCDAEEGFQMRVDGLHGPGTVEYLRLDPADGNVLFLRQQAPNGVVVQGTARRAGEEGEAGPAEELADEAMFSTGDVQDLGRALDRGLDQLMMNWPGLSGADREEMQRQLRQWTAPLAGLLAQNPQLANAVAQQQHRAAAPGEAAADFGALFDLQQVFGPLDMAFFGAGLGQGQGQGGARRAGVEEAVASSWLAGRALAGGEAPEADWQCPICFDSTATELVAVCKDEGGKALHVFHKQCVQDWLVRRDECPSCRRTPVVMPSAPAERTSQ